MERKRILIDTSILIDHLRKLNKHQTLFYKLATKYDYRISTITEFEFSVGITERNRKFSEILLSKLPVISLTSECIKTATEIYRELKSKNALISLPDIFISATAIHHKINLLTLNIDHFSRIQTLDLIDIENI